MKIVVVSGNAHKLAEIRQILGAETIGIRDLFPDYSSAEETGSTFEQNAMQKLAALSPDSAPGPANILLADDSGLEVEALNARPGIYSARYAPKSQECQKLLGEMAGKKNRKARFVCMIALKFPNGKIATAQGEIQGKIAAEMRGQNGFGYDPVFIPEGFRKTFAEMTSEEKNTLSHRYRALKNAKQTIENYFSSVENFFR